MYGHPRKGWADVDDVTKLGGWEKEKTGKGMLVVYGRSESGGVDEIFKVGPEPRPFPLLVNTDWAAVADEIVRKR